MTEDQLRDQLRRVDDLTPPSAPDFAARAIRASERRVERRRTWGKAVLGAAAAIAIGTLAVTNLPRPSGSTSSGVSGAAAPEAATAGGATAPTGLAPPYTGAECIRTLTGVRAAIPALTQQGLPIISAACDPRGVVVVRVGTALSPEQRSVLTTRYGAHVSVADRNGTPLP